MNNSTQIDPNEQASCPNAVSVFFTTIMAIIGLVAFIGNILVIASVYKTPNLRISTNYYYVNMAASDFLCSLTTWLEYLIDEPIAYGGGIIHGLLATVGCKTGVFITMVSRIVSILSMLLVAVDRFVATVFPLKATLIKRKLRAALLFATWFISTTFSLPMLYKARVLESREIAPQVCVFGTNIRAMMPYFITGLLLFIFLPLIAIVIIYSRIMLVLRRRQKPGYGARGSTSQRDRTKQNRKIMKIFKSIVAAYFICIIPFGLHSILKVISPTFNARDKCQLLKRVCYSVLPYLGGGINPVILFTFSSNFRRALQKLLPSVSLAKGQSCCSVLKQKEHVSQPELVTYKKTSSC